MDRITNFNYFIRAIGENSENKDNKPLQKIEIKTFKFSGENSTSNVKNLFKNIEIKFFSSSFVNSKAFSKSSVNSSLKYLDCEFSVDNNSTSFGSLSKTLFMLENSFVSIDNASFVGYNQIEPSQIADDFRVIDSEHSSVSLKNIRITNIFLQEVQFI